MNKFNELYESILSESLSKVNHFNEDLINEDDRDYAKVTIELYKELKTFINDFTYDEVNKYHRNGGVPKGIDIAVYYYIKKAESEGIIDLTDYVEKNLTTDLSFTFDHLLELLTTYVSKNARGVKGKELDDMIDDTAAKLIPIAAARHINTFKEALEVIIGKRQPPSTNQYKLNFKRNSYMRKNDINSQWH